MSLSHDPLIQPKHLPFGPVKRIKIRRFRQFPEIPTQNIFTLIQFNSIETR